MEISVKKKKVMVFSKKQGTKNVIEVNGEKLEQVSGSKYLGSWVTEDGKSEKEVKAIELLWQKGLSGSTKNY